MFSNKDLEKMIEYLFYFALLLFGATILGLALSLIKIGLNLIGVSNPL